MWYDVKGLQAALRFHVLLAIIPNHQNIVFTMLFRRVTETITHHLDSEHTESTWRTLCTAPLPPDLNIGSCDGSSVPREAAGGA